MERKIFALLGESEQVWAVRNALALEENFTIRVIENRNILRDAFANCYGVFVAAIPGSEDCYEINDFIIDAAAEAGVAHIICAMPAIQHLSKLEYSFPYQWVKNTLKEIENNSVLKVSVVRTPVFYEQMIRGDLVSFDEEGKGIFAAAHKGKQIPAASMADLGFVVGMMFRYSDYYGQRIVGVVGDDLLYNEYIRQLLESSGIDIADESPQPLYFPGSLDMFLGGVAFAESCHSFLPDRIESYGLHPGMQPFSRWLKRNREVVANHLELMRKNFHHPWIN